MIVRAPVAHDADRLDRQQDGERLPDLIVQSRLADLLDVNGVDLAQEIEALLGDGSEHADREAGARKRVTPDDLLRQPQLASDQPDLVLEQLP